MCAFNIIKTLLPSVLICIYPAMFLYCNNVDEMSLSEIWNPLWIFTIAGVIAFLLCCAACRSWKKGGFFSFFLCLAGMNFAYIENAVHMIIPVGKYWHIFPVVLAVLLIIVNELYHRLEKEWGTQFFLVASVVPAVLILFNVVFAIPQFVKQFETQPVNQESDRNIAQVSSENLPNVYYFLFDEYSNFDILEKYYDYDNSAFAKFLEDNKFTVSYDSMNESQETATVTTNYVNLNYVVNDTDSSEKRAEIRYQGYLFDLVRAYGYQIVPHGMSASWFGLGGASVSSTISGDSALTILLRNTAYYPFIKDNTYAKAEQFLDSMALFTKNQLYIDNTMKFHLAYYQMPHQPFVFDQDGNEVPLQHTNDWMNPEYYLNQLIFTTKEIEKIIPVILENDPGAVIILQSDHSARNMENENHELLIDVYDRRHCLNAVYYGGEAFEDIKGKSGLNTLRIVFGRLLNEDLPEVEVPEK